jgi:hypothetical protein
MANTVHTVGHKRVNPSVYFSPIAHPVSNNPARNKMIHAIDFLMLLITQPSWLGEVTLVFGVCQRIDPG